MKISITTVDVSVIIPTYNRNRPLRTTLESVLSQSPAPAQILVIDQSEAHDADTSNFLEDLIKSQKIEYLHQDVPNAQHARNLGIANATGEVLLFLDDDIVAEPNLVEAHWRNYQDSSIGAVCGFFLDPEEIPVEELPDVCHRPVTGWIYAPHCYAKRTLHYSWPSGNGSVRKHIAMSVGGFDENFTRTLFDDADFCVRMKQHGVLMVHDPEARLLHMKEPSGGKRPGSLNEYVIADQDQWYIWCYFFLSNFGLSSWREILIRLRACVFRRKTLVKPWFFLIALTCFITGFITASTAIVKGRRLASFHVLAESL